MTFEKRLPRTPRGASQAGFTLLELVVSFTILALMAGIVFSSLSFVLNSYESSQERMEDQARERVLIDHVRRQVGSLFPLRPTGDFAASETDQGQADPLTQLVQSQVPLFYGQDDYMTFISVSPLILGDQPGLTVVRYGAAQDEYGDFYLGAMETPFSGIMSFEEMSAMPRGKPLPLVEGVEHLSFEYYGYDPNTETSQWFPYWDGSEMQAVPQGVRINFNDRSLVVQVNANFFGGGTSSSIRNLLQSR